VDDIACVNQSIIVNAVARNWFAGRAWPTPL
jgi:hypothetical protein